MMSGSCWWYCWLVLLLVALLEGLLSLLKCVGWCPLDALFLFKRTALWWPSESVPPPLQIAFPVPVGLLLGNACGSGRRGWLGPLLPDWLGARCSALWLLSWRCCRLLRWLRRWTTMATVRTIKSRVAAAPTSTPSSGVIWKYSAWPKRETQNGTLSAKFTTNSWLSRLCSRHRPVSYLSLAQSLPVMYSQLTLLRYDRKISFFWSPYVLVCFKAALRVVVSNVMGWLRPLALRA